MVKAVFDTVIFVRCLINPYSHWGRLVLLSRDKYRLITSNEIVEEYLEVLHRPELTKKYKTLLEIDLNEIVELLKNTEMISVASFPKVSRDIKDDKFLAAAVSGSADYLVSEDRDLLDIVEYKKVKIVTAHEFLLNIS